MLMLGGTVLYAQITTYTYTGKNFTSATFPYSTSDAVTGTVVFPNPLPGNLLAVNVGGGTPSSWSFSDGLNTWNNTNASFSLTVVTDHQGNITAWSVGVTPYLPGTQISAVGNSANPSLSANPGDNVVEEFPANSGNEVSAGNTSSGVWTTFPAPLTVTTLRLPNARSGAPYSVMLGVSGGSGSGYQWSVSSGSPPTGFTLSGAGVLSSTGSPAAPGNLYTFTVQVADSASHTATQSLTLEIPTAQATTYIYTGKNFTSAASPYTSSDSVTGTITTASPLPTGQSFLQINNLLNWSFSDGVQTLDVTNSAATVAQVATDAQGNIISWHIFITAFPNAQILTCGGVIPGCSPSDNANTEYTVGFTSTASQSAQGSWSIYMAPAGWSITDLGTLGGPSSAAWAINDSFQVVGGSTTSTSGCALPEDCGHAFSWSGSGPMQDLGTAGGAWSAAEGINSNGQVVGAVAAGLDERGFLYYSGTTLGTFGGPVSDAKSINASGQVAGFAYIPTSVPGGYEHAFRYVAGSMADLGTLGGEQSAAAGINNAGQVVGASQLSGNISSSSFFPGHAFLYSGSGPMTDLGTLGGTSSSANAINNLGHVTGVSQLTGDSSSTWSSSHAFLYSTGSGMNDIGTLGGTNSFGYAINDVDQVVGISTIPNGGCVINLIGSPDGTCGHAFLYTAGVMSDLNSSLPPNSGWVLTVATGINNTGGMAGYGTNGDGHVHAFLLKSQIGITASGLAYSRATGTYNGTVTIQNSGSNTINGPLELLFLGLTAGVTLTNETGNLTVGTPYMLIPSVASLAPAQSVTVNVQFKNPANAKISFTPQLFTRSVN